MFKCFYGSSATAYLNRVPCSLQMRAIGFNTIPILYLGFSWGSENSLAIFYSIMGSAEKVKKTAGLCHNQEDCSCIRYDYSGPRCLLSNDQRWLRGFEKKTILPSPVSDQWPLLAQTAFRTTTSKVGLFCPLYS